LVDEGAATNSLFSKEDIKIQLAEIVSHPDFETMMLENRNEFPLLMNIVNQQSEPMSLMDMLKSLFTSEAQKNELSNQNTTDQMNVETNAPVPVEQVAASATPEASPSPAVPPQGADPNKALLDQLLKLSDQLTQLSAKVTALENQPAAPPTELNTGAGAPTEKKKEIWFNDPINQEAIKLYNELNPQN
jgi:hypothetical protein